MDKQVKVSGELIYGRRAVSEAIAAGAAIEELWLQDREAGNLGGSLPRFISVFKGQIHYLRRAELDHLTSGASHQGVVARVRAGVALSVNQLLERLEGAPPQPVILLDGVQDPQNLGAIMRSAEVLGAGGIILRRRRAAGLTPAAVKASAGAAFHLRAAETPNLDYAVRLLKEAGYWIYGFDSSGEDTLWDLSLTGRLGFIFGAEGVGLAALTRKRCDRLVRIPQRGRIGSLNVSVAVGVVMAEWLRQQKSGGDKEARNGGSPGEVR